MAQNSRDSAIPEAARAILAADALLTTAGAGMGVDSGLPDFRGPEGFWQAYPAYARLGLQFEELANPRWFHEDPELAWGFYGHRLNLYRSTVPHEGFSLLLRWSARAAFGSFVFTSNVDGQFQRAGFGPDNILECHGAIGFLQCTRDCGAGVFPAPDGWVHVDIATCRAQPPLPSCPQCGALARPNILMFGDWSWDSSRTEAQERRLRQWMSRVVKHNSRLVVVECGAGTAIPTVRHFGQHAVSASGATLVRINPQDARGTSGTISIAGGALESIQAIDRAMRDDP
jgi:NAD-dependent SIR2 family protein deacetylase